ncbi:RNA 2'-phosphotransferase [Chitinophaga agrisoli]|uniref:Probable RNA 2'-phosphotransferase n=1 Tax=Chitinophaga agrisoli TaxID=2607653 RepID=A0A5B2VZS2_9BACT|nr:RNA 2'-phosphotransferase [Chitinophaga agrisoli]KAA2244911.1 RNA 2'-phosphotransferase [Chitinophaga agrisoli]
MNEKQQKTISKFLSLILRHSPETINLQLDENGWADVQELLAKAAQHGQRFSLEELENIVASSDKQRFAFNETHTRIRANQGHSITVDLGLSPQVPPEYLYHGTVNDFLESIQQEGLLKMSRQHLHLSIDKATAEKVGSRRGRPVILTINSGQMHRDGLQFFLSENGVWLTDHVPARYIQL